MADISQKNGGISQLEALGFVWDVLASVAIPTAAFALLGRYIDKEWGTSPYATIIGLLLACVIVAFLVLKKAKKMAERLKSPRV